MSLSEHLQKLRLSQAELASRLDVTPGMVGHWVHGRSRITAEQAVAIERATAGAIPRHALRPDVFEQPAA